MGHLQEKIIKCLEEHKKLTAKQLARLCDASLTNIWQSLLRLEKWSVISKTVGKDSKTYWKLKKEVEE